MNSSTRRTASSNAAPAILSSTSPFPWVQPDIKGNGPEDLDLWLYRDLEPIGRPGATGNFAKLGSFAVAIPPYSGYRNGANWLEKEIVAVGPKGQLWYVAGEPGVYRRLSQPAHVNLIGRLTTVSSWRCGGHRLHCVASEARPSGLGARLGYHPFVDCHSRSTLRMDMFHRCQFRGSIAIGRSRPAFADTLALTPSSSPTSRFWT